MQTEQRKDIVAEIERRRGELNLGLLRIYNIYRVFLGAALLGLFQQPYVRTQLGSYDADFFQLASITYIFVNVLVTLSTRWVYRAPGNPNVLNMLFACADTAGLVALMYASGGVTSGIAPLILITVAAGAILVTGRRATFVAAFATMALFYEEFYFGLSRAASGDYFQAGLFGAIYFTASLGIQQLSNRIRTNEIRALAQASELADMERLNRQIVQRMRTGIIVVDANNGIRMHNQSARAFVGAGLDEPLHILPPALQNAITTWRENTHFRVPPMKITDATPEIRVNFAALRSEEPQGDVTLFIEDTGEMQQQAQQLKLAELGRLSASIAHEVRNPLGAISHAAQLLNESDGLLPADQRLTDIIINHSKRMNGVVENVLEMSRRRHPEPQLINLADNIQQFIAQSREGFPEASIETDIASDTTVRIDPANLNQALTNLVDNALRYSAMNSQGQRVRLEGGVEQDSERPFLKVIDFGQGVEESQLPYLFQPFSTTAAKGTGLGLYIARELCGANQAHISYTRAGTGGGCFRILFAHPAKLTV